MLYVVSVDFNHDCSDKEERFRQFADAAIASGAFDSEPIIEHTPVFSYSQIGRAHLDALIDRIGNLEAIAFLSDICFYSYVIVQAAGELGTQFSTASTYESFSLLKTNPTLQGYSIPTDGSIRLLDRDCLVVSMMPWNLVSVESEEPNPAIIDVVHRLDTGCGAVYCYRIRDLKRYFESLSCDWPIYVFKDSGIEVETALKLYVKEELTEHLLSMRTAFGTLNDNHQDDFYAVSYYERFWHVDGESLAFIA